jgi:hypothetical protein
MPEHFVAATIQTLSPTEGREAVYTIQSFPFLFRAHFRVVCLIGAFCCDLRISVVDTYRLPALNHSP